MSGPRFDWKHRVDAALDVAAANKPPVYGDPKLKVTFRTSAVELIRAAAAVRGVSVAGFVRRAAIAMAAEVLGIPYPNAISLDPTIQRDGEYAPAADPDGIVGGPWEITGLK